MEHKRYQRILATLAVFAMLFCDLNVSSFAEGNTEAEEDRIRTICGLEEHTHTDECYEKTLICGRAESGKKTEKRFKAFQIHEHNDSCYDENGNLNCGIIEGKYYHAHNEYCYDNAGNLVCGLEEVWPHEHTDACYETEKKLICKKEETEGHKHTDACYKQNRELICEKAEDPGHHHSDACYTEHTTLTCGKQEDPGHHHSDACYTEHTELTCEKQEDPGHHHSDACYTEQTNLTCGKQEDPGHHHGDACYRDQKVLICEQEGNEDHTHTEECYTILRELICEEPERDGHTHGESCYTTTRELTCGETERDGHTHGESCYTKLRELTCGEAERDGHTHGESCYTSTRDLACRKPERDGHTHTDDCYRIWNEQICGKEEKEGHTHNESCYETQKNLICEELSTTHHHTAACRNEEGRLICGEVEVQEFVSSADRWTEEVISEGHHHTDDCYEQTLICEKEEHTHTDACYPASEETEEPDEESADNSTEEPTEATGEETGSDSEDGEETDGTNGEDSEDNEDGETDGEDEAGEEADGETEENSEDSEDGEADSEDETGEEAGEENEEDSEDNEDGEADSEDETGEEAGEENEEDAEDNEDGETDGENEDGEETDEEELTEEPNEVTLSAEDAPVAVSISFLSNAGIPEGTKLVVSETGEELPTGEKSQVRFAKAAPMKSAGLQGAATPQERHVDIPSMAVWNAGETAPDIIFYQKTLDISLVSEGAKIEPDPEALITVTVQLPGVVDGQVVEVRHITDGGTELLESTNDAGSITFTTNGFSLFEFTSRAQALSAWSTGQTANTFYGKTTNQEAYASAISVSSVTEGLEVLEAYSLTRSSDLWMTLQQMSDPTPGKLESLVLYTVEDGTLGAIVRDNVSQGEVLRFNLGDMDGYALVRDTGLRHIVTEQDNVTLDGMMPKNSVAEVSDVTGNYSGEDFRSETQPEDEGKNETIRVAAAYDISILNDGEDYQPEAGQPISIEIRDDRIPAEGEIELWHIRDDGTREQVTGFTTGEGRITFEATGFSVYLVIIHEDGTVENPRVEFHFIADGAAEDSDGTNIYYVGNPYVFKNKDGNEQSTQILADGESLELIADPGNQETRFFYGWYVVNAFPVSGTTDEYGIGKTDSKLYFTWPATPEPVSFNHTMSITENSAQIGDTVHWSLGNISGSGTVDSDGNVHVFLAPVFEKYNFVNFMLYPWKSGVSNSTNVMTRKLIALGSSTSVEIKISDVRSTSSDPVHLIFIGWQYNAGTEENPDWRDYQTVEYTGAEMADPGKDGVYLNINLADKSSVDLYPIFVQARWVDYNPGKSGNGATYVPSAFRESWGPDPSNPPAGMTNDSERNVFTHMTPSSREGYVFGGWYAYAATDSATGEIANLVNGADVQADYITSANEGYEPNELTLSNQQAIQITNGDGDVVYNGSFTVNGYTLFSGDGSTLKLYDSLDRLTLYAYWIPNNSKITIIYWTENAEDDNYTASAAKTVYTSDLTDGLGRPIASGSTITLEDLKNYIDVDYHVGIVSRDILDDVGAVQAIPEQDPDSNEAIVAREEIFFDLKEGSPSDTSKVIDGQGNTTFNVYFSRKVFKLVFHIGRDGYVKNAGRQKAANDNWLEWMYKDPAVTAVLGHEGKGSQSYTGLAHMTYKGITYDSSYVTDTYNIKKDYVPDTSIQNDQNLYIIEAKYGAYIGDRWPSPVNTAFTFDTITAPEDKKVKTPYIWTAYYDSLYYRNSTKRDPAGSSSNNNPDINGIHNYMSGELCADQTGTHIINVNQVHHMVCYFGEASNNNRYKQYHILKEAVEGVELPNGTETKPGTDYSAYLPTEWSKKFSTTSAILPHSYYELSKESPTPVISNQQPQHQLGPELEGFTQVYSCYDPQTRPSSTVPSRMESHIYFFYTPKQYTLKFMYESGTVEKVYYYGASLADGLEGCNEPEKEGYYFKGWYANEAGEGQPFDFAKTTMPADNIVLYPVMKPLQYTVKIDPNGGVIDHRSNSSQSTYFTANYGTTIGEYSIKRGYIRLTDKELDENEPTTYYTGTKYYYINTQYLGESHEGAWGYPTELRNAVYVAEDQIDAYYNYYCSIIDNADMSYWTGIRKLTKQEFLDTYASYPYRPIDAGNEHYSFMGWYQVYSDGSVTSMPYNFNDPVTGPLTLRAQWRLDGGYYIQYNPYFFHEDEEGNITVIVGEMEKWKDPDSNFQLYADQAPTHILRAPTNTTTGWVFRGWRVVKAAGNRTYTDDEGHTHEFTVWEPIDNQNIIYYQPGENFTIDSNLVSQITNLGSVIHMQAYYEREEESERRPLIANLILDSNDSYGGGYINSTDSNTLPPLNGPGASSINTTDNLFEGKPTQIRIGDFQTDNMQSNVALHLYRYATTKTFNSVAGMNFFQTDAPYMLIGFDENADPEHPTTGSAYVPAYAPDSVIAVTRNDNRTLYAMWEPMIYVTLVNDTAEPIEVVLNGHGTDMIRIINEVAGEYEREESSNEITVPAHGQVKIVLPVANTSSDTITATAINDHYQKRMSVKGELDMGPDQARVSDGIGCEDIPYGHTTTFTEGTLRLSPYSLIITYTEVPDMSVDFDVNGGTWQETSQDYILGESGLYSIDSAKIIENNNQYEPTNPTHPDASKVFIGWTTNPDIASHTDFTGTNSVTWGNTVIDIKDYDNLLDAIMHDYIWDFSKEPPYEEILYAVYSDVVTVTFDLRKTGDILHNWTGPATTDTDGLHVFYRSSPTSRYVTYRLLPGEKVQKPSDPTASDNWYFIAWLDNCSLFTDRTVLPNGKIGNTTLASQVYDFSIPVTEDKTLFTSWTLNIPQHYTFTVKNQVVNGNENDKFTYTISVSNAQVWGKHENGSRFNGPSETDWGSVSLDLKNNQQYTVLVTVKYFVTSGNNSWDACSVEIDVIDQNGNNIKNENLVTLAKGNSAPSYVGGYNYQLSITQEPKADFESTIAVEDVANTAYSRDPNTLTFLFESKWGSSLEGNSNFNKTLFPPEKEKQVNGFIAGEENKLTIIFTNTCDRIVAPTGIITRRTPYFLLMVFGFILMTVLGCVGFVRRREHANGNDDLPDLMKAKTHSPAMNAANSISPPRSEARNEAPVIPVPVTGTENHIRWRNSVWVDNRNLQARGKPPCPRVNLWTQTQGPPGRRGDPVG